MEGGGEEATFYQTILTASAADRSFPVALLITRLFLGPENAILAWVNSRLNPTLFLDVIQAPKGRLQYPEELPFFSISGWWHSVPVEEKPGVKEGSGKRQREGGGGGAWC